MVKTFGIYSTAEELNVLKPDKMQRGLFSLDMCDKCLTLARGVGQPFDATNFGINPFALIFRFEVLHKLVLHESPCAGSIAYPSIELFTEDGQIFSYTSLVLKTPNISFHVHGKSSYPFLIQVQSFLP